MNCRCGVRARISSPLGNSVCRRSLPGLSPSNSPAPRLSLPAGLTHDDPASRRSAHGEFAQSGTAGSPRREGDCWAVATFAYELLALRHYAEKPVAVAGADADLWCGC